MVHSSIQPVRLVDTAHALENGNAISAHPPEEACPYWVLRSREQKRTLRHAFLVCVGLHLVLLEPGGGENVVLDDGAGCFLGDRWLRSTSFCGMGGLRRRRTGRGEATSAGAVGDAGVAKIRERVRGCGVVFPLARSNLGLFRHGEKSRRRVAS
jgi:hypothetical protein